MSLASGDVRFYKNVRCPRDECAALLLDGCPGLPAESLEEPLSAMEDGDVLRKGSQGSPCPAILPASVAPARQARLRLHARPQTYLLHTPQKEPLCHDVPEVLRSNFVRVRPAT